MSTTRNKRGAQPKDLVPRCMTCNTLMRNPIVRYSENRSKITRRIMNYIYCKECKVMAVDPRKLEDVISSTKYPPLMKSIGRPRKDPVFIPTLPEGAYGSYPTVEANGI